VTLTDLLYQALELSRRALDSVSGPGPIYLFIRKAGDDMATEYQATGLFQPVRPGDKVATREVVVTLNGAAQPAVNLPATANQYDQWFREGDRVKYSLTDIDQAGNRSQVRESAEITVADTVPPAQPGELALSVTGQREAEEPTPPA
jgi:hypothetical protein